MWPGTRFAEGRMHGGCQEVVVRPHCELHWRRFRKSRIAAGAAIGECRGSLFAVGPMGETGYPPIGSSGGWYYASRMRRFLRDNGLSLVVFALFLATFAGGQIVTGWRVYNEGREQSAQTPVALGQYLCSAHFAEATAENWESEFLQMGVYVLLTALLYQRGSAESDDPDEPSTQGEITAESPWPVRRGGAWRALYGHSLSLAFLLLFCVSFGWHAWGSLGLENEERARHGELPTTFAAHLGGAKFWFESFQNWQSEFLAIGSMVVLSIWLREKNSPESKRVEAPHTATGA